MAMKWEPSWIDIASTSTICFCFTSSFVLRHNCHWFCPRLSSRNCYDNNQRGCCRRGSTRRSRTDADGKRWPIPLRQGCWESSDRGRQSSMQPPPTGQRWWWRWSGSGGSSSNDDEYGGKGKGINDNLAPQKHWHRQWTMMILAFPVTYDPPSTMRHVGERGPWGAGIHKQGQPGTWIFHCNCNNDVNNADGNNKDGVVPLSRPTLS